MSLGVVIKGPEGIVLAADSRVTLEARRGEEPTIVVHYDNATKLLSFGTPNNYVGAVTYGAAIIGLRTAHSFVPEFELTLPDERLTVQDFASALSGFFIGRWKEGMPEDFKGPSMSFVVGGYDPDAAYGKVFVFSIPESPTPEPRNPGEKDFGMTWGGQLEVVSRIVHGYDPALVGIVKEKLGPDDQQTSDLLAVFRERLQFRIPYEVLPLQDCVDLATFLVRTTMTAQALGVGIRGVGGAIDVAMITRTKGLEYVQQKQIHGESQSRV